MAQKRRGRAPSDEERALWTRAMSAVEPVRRRQNRENQILLRDVDAWSESVDDTLARPKVIKSAAPTRMPDASIPSVSKTTRSAELPRLEVGKNGGTDRRTADRLRRGRLAIDMRLDLHGLTLDVAHRRLLGFLNAAQSSGARCVLVITGKGSRNNDGIGRLRAAVPRWLNEPAFRSLVLSVSEAQPRDGGTGALYILVRKMRGDRP